MPSFPWYYYFLNIEVMIFLAVIVATLCLAWSRRNKSVTTEGVGAYQWDIPLLRKSPIRSTIPVVKPKKRLYKHEERCREIFEQIFQAKFPSTRAEAWLKNPVTGKNLELDGYNPSIPTPKGRGLAFEYDGEQHARYSSRVHGSGPNEFLYQVKKDQWKDLKCKEHNVLLVRIPHFVHYSQLEPYIKEKLRRLGMSGAVDQYENRQ